MRKWMRDRLQRRKKTPAESAETTPPPLQPAYFDAGQQPESADAAAPVETERSPEPGAEEVAPRRVAAPRPARRSRSAAREAAPEVRAADTDSPEPVAQEPNVEEPPTVTEPSEAQPRNADRPSSGSSGRGRRRRGGRGRGGRGGREQAVAHAFTPAAVKGSIPGLPVDDEVVDTGADVGEDDAQPTAAPVAAAPRIPSTSRTSAAPRVPVAAVAATPRPPKGVVVLAIGLPGSGKSTWFKRHDIVPLSSDMVRTLLFDDVREQRFQDLVFSNLRSMLKARLIAKRPMNYVDATNLTPQERQHWIKLAKDYQYEVHAVFFDVPLEVCLDRHQRRDRVVPEDVMRRMAAKLKAPGFDEGFEKITVVRVKKKDEGAAAETPVEAK